MWIIFLVAVVGYSFWLWVIGLVWLTLLILPYLILCGLFFYFFRRELRRRTEMRAMLERQVDRQRQLNAQDTLHGHPPRTIGSGPVDGTRRSNDSTGATRDPEAARRGHSMTSSISIAPGARTSASSDHGRSG